MKLMMEPEQNSPHLRRETKGIQITKTDYFFPQYNRIRLKMNNFGVFLTRSVRKEKQGFNALLPNVLYEKKMYYNCIFMSIP